VLKKLQYSVGNTLLKGGFIMARKNNTYSNELKLKVVKSYMAGEGSYENIAQAFDIKNSSQV